MLYDPRWERRRAEPPSRREGAFDFLLATLVPVFIGASTLAAVYDRWLLLVLPVGANLAALALLRRDGAAGNRRGRIAR